MLQLAINLLLPYLSASENEFWPRGREQYVVLVQQVFWPGYMG